MANRLSEERQEDLLGVLAQRFEDHMHRHEGVSWAAVEERLRTRPDKLWSLGEMERTGGEPDVVSVADGAYLFMDCSPQSPSGRRSLCYDREAQESRKEHAPEDNAVDMAAAMGVMIVSETEYRALQELGSFDTTTSSWLKTPPGIRELGGALFADRRYDTVFVYHNSAPSYYAARGFRAVLRV